MLGSTKRDASHKEVSMALDKQVYKNKHLKQTIWQLSHGNGGETQEY